MAIILQNVCLAVGQSVAFDPKQVKVHADRVRDV